jgi:hypothetical protein
MEVAIGGIRLEDGVVELFDATVAQPPHKVRMTQIQATLNDVLVPSPTGNTTLDFAATIKGVGGALKGLFGGPKKEEPTR